MHAGILRRQFHGMSQLHDRAVNFLLVEQGFAQGTMSARKFWINRNRLAESFGCEIELIFLEECHSQIVGRIEICGIQLESSLQCHDRSIDQPGMRLRHTEIKESKCVVGTE